MINSQSWKDQFDTFNRRLGFLRAERAPYDMLWRKIDHFVSTESFGLNKPFYGEANGLSHGVHDSSGAWRNIPILDNTATKGVRILASGLMSGSTPPSKPWLTIQVSDTASSSAEDVHPDISKIFAERQRILMDHYNKSNLYYVYNLAYEDLARYGTHVHLVREDAAVGVRLEHVPIYEAYLTKDYRGFINGLFRVYRKTVSQIIEEFGEENAGDQVLNSYRNNDLDVYYPLVNVILQRDTWREPQAPDDMVPSKYKRYGSWHFLETSGHLLRESGFSEFPVVAPRWALSSTDTYGYSPVMEALTDITLLQEYAAIEKRSAEEAGYPQMLVDSRLRDQVYKFAPRAMHFVSDLKDSPIRPLFDRHPSFIAEIKDLIRDKRSSVNDSLFVNIFMMMNRMDESRMTATEVAARKEEQMLMMGHAVTRLQNEMLMPDAVLSYNALERAGAFPEFPEMYDQIPAHLEFTSVIAQAQKSIGVVTIDRGLIFLQGIASINPEVVDVFNFDETVRTYMDLLGMGTSMLKSKEDVQRIRDARAQQQQQQLAAEAEERQIRMQKDLASAHSAMSEIPLPGAL